MVAERVAPFDDIAPNRWFDALKERTGQPRA
jgi:hypothetical protein